MTRAPGDGPAARQRKPVAMPIAKTSSPRLPATRLHVCPLATLHDTIASSGAAHLITVINAQTMPDTPPVIEPRRHLKIAVNDIAAPQPGLIHPNEVHIDELLRYARDWDHGGPLVVHCWAGISRSTAAAFITLCAVNEPGAEAAIAQALRAASSTATPNSLMVELADDALGRDGRMVDAVLDIGQGETAMCGIPFSLPSRFRPI